MKVILSAAVSLDGYLDDLSPERLKLSSGEDWAAVQKLRGQCDAILVGAGTVRRDNPSLVIRDQATRQERIAAGMEADIAKVVVSRSGCLDPESKFFTEGSGRKIVFMETPDGTDAARRMGTAVAPVAPELAQAAEIIAAQHITARFICSELSAMGYGSLMVEGGSQILTMFLEEGVADEFRLAIAPFFVGKEGAPKLACPGIFPWGKDNRMAAEKVELLGDTTVIHLIPKK